MPPGSRKRPKSLSFPPDIRKIDPNAPDPEIIKYAARVIKNGGVAGIPTTCLYGLGADALNHEAVGRLFEIKQRPSRKPILALIHHPEILDMLVRKIPQSASRLMDAFWPGGITIVFDAIDALPASLTAGTGKIGIRCCGHPVARALAELVGGPVTGTSANLAGHPGCARISDFDAAMAEKLDVILDAGNLEGGVGSTVIDVTGEAPVILREGAVPAREIFMVLE